ncbi:hypothetical protein MIND_00763800 [Mycena indigotica]|uniref:Uncharacterized protein n=1 Tax=Mycena indigotica TaxID=2126181 RepID=A0A8H6SPG3_9AGAR|nr:uncharacterized protein MIND_00763800 [Mycena indigotica]KAF7301977.1 hypothetical protein MIND_00763800 [Mycena indigotica]
MPKQRYACELCQRPLRNLGEAKTNHDRACSGFKRLHLMHVSRVQEDFAARAKTHHDVSASPPPAPPGPAQVIPIDDAPPVKRKSGLPARRTRVPAKFNDAAPPPAPRLRRLRSALTNPGVGPVSLPPSQSQPEIDAAPPAAPSQQWLQTEPNEFGLYKVYPRRPTHDPDAFVQPKDLYRVAQHDERSSESIPLPTEPWFYPFPNPSVAHLIKYHVEEENPQSIAGFDRFIQSILLPNAEAQSDGVSLSELPTPFSTQKFLDKLDKHGVEPLGINDKWSRGAVMLKLPCVGVHQAESNAPVFIVDNIYYRPLLDPIQEVLQGPLFQQLHTTPFSLRAAPGPQNGTMPETMPNFVTEELPTIVDEHGLPPLPKNHEEVFGEIYTSAAMLEAYHAIPQPPPPQTADDPVESIVLALMEWSDATHLAQFGTASLWPAYTFFGNHPKDFRGKPTSKAGFHQAYFASLPDSVRDSYRQQYGCDMPDEVYTHLKRELIHEIWNLLLSDNFMDAYDNGIKIKCWDGIIRLVFPRFFIYGADYPEKVLLATIRSLGGKPCPRCFVEKKKISETGTVNDMKRRKHVRIDNHPRRATIEDARKAMFSNGNSLIGSSLNAILKKDSWNAFSKLDTPKTPFNLFSMFRQIPTFGRATIRSFSHNVSELKYAAARDYEDILQCILPVLEGLFPSHQSLVDQLCFELALWHGYAKLCMHTTSSIESFRAATTTLCSTIRRFARETADIKTFELPREERRRTKKKAPSTSPTHVVDGNQERPGKQRTKKLEKPFNLITYKLHALPDYPDAILRFGTTDSTSTQNGELAHRLVKHFYKRTNKRNHVGQIAAHERRRRLMRTMWENRKRFKSAGSKPVAPAATTVKHILRARSKRQRRLQVALHPEANPRYSAYIPPEQHHYISNSTRTFWHLADIMGDSTESEDEGDGPPINRMEIDPPEQDPVLKDFVRHLKSHLRQRLLNLEDNDIDTQFNDEELISVVIQGDLIYTHATMRVNYTTYDVQRDQDVLNPRTRKFLIVHAQDPEDHHRYWYGELLGIFHCYAVLADQPRKAERMEFLWVRWLQRDISYPCGFREKRLPRLSYMPFQSPDAFGFLDPMSFEVLISYPRFTMDGHATIFQNLRFSEGQSMTKIGNTIMLICEVVDRDMLMRYHTNAIGHRKVAARFRDESDDLEATAAAEDVEMEDINEERQLEAPSMEDDDTGGRGGCRS